LSVIENALARLRRSAGLPGPATRPGTAPPRPARAQPGSPTETGHVPRKQFSIRLPELRRAGYLPDEDQEWRFADYCQRIKRPIIEKALSAGATEDLRLILLTSPLAGEGKTLTTLNLALSMARERDVSVLLVDADLPKGDISRVLGLQGEPGLLDALRDDTRDVESLVVGTDIPGLDVLPAGTHGAGIAELIASARMREVAMRLSGASPHRLVLFDSPPLLVSGEARALAHIPGQIILVARAGQTPCQAILAAIAHVDKKKLQGLVLNDAYLTSEDGYYGYSYGAPQEAVAKPD
jgi:protein-tyrosine kinase